MHVRNGPISLGLVPLPCREGLGEDRNHQCLSPWPNLSPKVRGFLSQSLILLALFWSVFSFAQPARADVTIDPNSTGATDVVQDPDGTPVLLVNPLPDPLDLGSYPLAVGNTADGTLAIENSGLVSNGYGFIGYGSGSTGNVTVDGTGSMWTNSFLLFVGSYGRGTLNITGGGAVCNYSGYIGRESDSTGTVTVDGTGSTWTNDWSLFVGCYGSGTLHITGGGEVSNDDEGRIGDGSSSIGIVTVDGVGSTWTNGGDLSIGCYGNGVLDISDGGAVSVAGDTWVTRRSGASGEIHFDGGTLTTGGLYCALDDLTGTGTIHTDGLVTDVDLVFDTTHGLNQTFTLNQNPGQDITVDLNVDSSRYMGAGYTDTGTMSISDGVVVPSSYGYIGYKPDSNGTVTVNGLGSSWTNSRWFYVGYFGRGTLNITGGGAVSNDAGFIGYESGSTGTVTVDGTDSTWTSSSLYVGYSGSGAINITGGGAVSNGYGFIGCESGSTGTVTVDGIGSIWTNAGSLHVGRSGNGTLHITGGGAVSNIRGLIGSGASSTGTVTVDGPGSTWTNSSDLTVGWYGSGTLNITDGGLVSVGGDLTIDVDTNGDAFIYMATGGMLALASDEYGDDSLGDFLDLVDGNDAIRYWDFSQQDWAPITGATYGDDYTIEYLTTGSLAGYTLLTVGITGDFDGDGDVDGADYLAWQRGETPNPLNASELTGWENNFGFPFEGDFDTDGDVDGADFLAWQRGQSPDPLSAEDLALWQNQFNSGAAAPATTAVPEPTSLVLAVLGMLAAMRFRN